MARQVIDIGLQGNDGSGDSVREAFRKVNDNFRDLYAVFGKGGQIAFTDLDDAPSTYTENQVFITDVTGASITARTLVSGSGITILNDPTASELTIGLSNGGLADVAPQLIGPLSGNGLPIAKVAEPSLDAVATWNIAHEAHSAGISIDDIVITKGYADKRYVLGGESIPIRVRAEPIDSSEYVKTVTSWTNTGNAFIAAHGFTAISNGFKVRFDSTGVAPTPLVSGNAYFIRYATDDELSVHPTQDDAKNNTNKIIVADDGTGVETITDFYYNPSLGGFWLSNEALPRDQVVRRGGDSMAGFLTLHADPSSNLHAATKQYVDGAAVSGSRSSISVANSGTLTGSHHISYDPNTGIITFVNSLETGEISTQGFPNRVDSKISFNNSNRTFTIEPASVGGSFVVWTKGTRREYNSAQLKQLPDTTGLYYLYFDVDGVLQYNTTHFDFEFEHPVSYIYWNATANVAPFVADERHGTTMSWAVHAYLHRTRGAAFASGFSITYNNTGDGSSDTHAQIDLTSGTFFDEDIECNITHSNAPIANTFQQDLMGPGKIPVFRMFGENEWLMDVATDFPLKQGTTNPQYNRFTPGAPGVWDTIDLADDTYGISWVVASNNITEPIFAILGQDQYANIGDAEAIAWADVILPNFPVFEYRPLYKLIYKVNSAYTNTVNAKLESVWDLRGISSTTVVAATLADHGQLSGLSDDDHEQYVHTSLARTITANHTFSGAITFTNSVNLPNSGVTAGSYTKVSVNVDGIITSGSSATTTDIAEGTRLYYTDDRVYTKAKAVLVAGNNVSITANDTAKTLTIATSANGQGGYNLNNNDTDDLAEGVTNLYFTDTRAQAAISVSGSLSYVSGVISYTTPTTIASLSNHTTTDLTEGTHLYFTDTRAQAAISVSGSLSYVSGVISYTTPTTIASLSNHTTDDLTEGSTKQYFTTARARSSVSAGSGIAYNSTSGIISTTISQYTDALAREAISGGTFVSYNNTTGVIDVTGTTAATASTLVERDSNAAITASKVYGTLVGNVQNFNLNSAGATLTAAQIVGNIFTCNPTVESFIQIPDATFTQGTITVAGYRILIRNRSSLYGVTIIDASSNTIVIVPPDAHAEIACDGFAWFVV